MKVKIEEEICGAQEEKGRQEGRLPDKLCMQPRVVLRRAELSEKYHMVWQEPELPGIKEEESEPPGGTVEKELQHPDIKKEEQLPPCVKKEGDFTELPVTGVHVMTDDEECRHEGKKGAEPLRSRSSQHMETEMDCEHDGGSQADSRLTPMSDGVVITSHAPHSEERQRDDDEEDEELEDETRRRTGSKRWKCPQCGKMFGSKSTLKTHVMGHTDEEEEEEEDITPPPQKRGRVERRNGAEEKAKDSTVWLKQQLGTPLGHRPVDGYSADGRPTDPVLQKVTTRLQSFLCFITLNMLCSIQQWTTQHGQDAQDDWFVSVNELMAFIGIIILRGVTKLSALQDSWSEKLGNPLIMKIMARKRFQDIMRHLRFDERDTRAEQVESDGFAAVSGVWTSFVANCISSYHPGRRIAVGEQLLPTKASCSFLRRFARKQGSFGIRFWVACDLKTKYVCNMIPDVGEDLGQTDNAAAGEDVVMKLMKPFLDKWRTVTTDESFTSLPLAARLLRRKTTLLGAVNADRPELPESAKWILNRRRYGTRVFSTPGASLTVYSPKRRKIVCILSTVHDVVEIPDLGNKKPNTVTDYNTMISGVDAMEQMVREHTVRTVTQHWPVAVFYNIVDIAALNASILYQACTGATERLVDFLVELASELAHFHLEDKKNGVESRPAQQAASSEPGKRGRCQVKRHCSSNHATRRCAVCDKYTCGRCKEEVVWTCLNCAD